MPDIGTHRQHRVNLALQFMYGSTKQDIEQDRLYTFDDLLGTKQWLNSGVRAVLSTGEAQERRQVLSYKLFAVKTPSVRTGRTE